MKISMLMLIAWLSVIERLNNKISNDIESIESSTETSRSADTNGDEFSSSDDGKEQKHTICDIYIYLSILGLILL